MIFQRLYYTEAEQLQTRVPMPTSDEAAATRHKTRKTSQMTAEFSERLLKQITSDKVGTFYFHILQAIFLADLMRLDITVDTENGCGRIILKGENMIFSKGFQKFDNDVRETLENLVQEFDDITFSSKDGLLEIKMLYKLFEDMYRAH